MAGWTIIDIETVLDTTLPAIDPAKFPPPSHHRVVAIGVLQWERGPKRMDVAHGDDEAANLARFAALMGRGTNLVTWNGRRFDLPVLAIRCLAHGIALPTYYGQRDYRYRFTEGGHWDVKDYLADFGAADACHQDHVAKLIGLPGKRDGFDGSQVGAAWANGERDRVANYCLEDVVSLTFIWLRTRLLAGHIDATEYTAAACQLWGFASADARTTALIGASEEGRLLLNQKEAAE